MGKCIMCSLTRSTRTCAQNVAVRGNIVPAATQVRSKLTYLLSSITGSEKDSSRGAAKDGFDARALPAPPTQITVPMKENNTPKLLRAVNKHLRNGKSCGNTAVSHYLIFVEQIAII